ncbi:MAG: hypothetical protein QXX17_02810 [Conexivisphaerales archaeon]
MSSRGIRVGAWDYLKLGDIQPIKRNGSIMAAKMIMRRGTRDEYFTFIAMV